MNQRSFQFLEVSASGTVATIALKNPARKNAIGPVMVNELLWALSDANESPDVRSIILTGAGDVFCSGGDFAQMAQSSGETALEHRGDYADLLLFMTRMPKPIIARVNGHAMGGGLGLVAASHFAVASRGSKLGTPEINVGLYPMMIMALLYRIIPRRKLSEMMLFGERLDADQAHSLGILNHVVDEAELDAAVQRIADTIAAKSPIAVRLGLEAFADQEDLPLKEALPLLRERLAMCLATDDAREGLTAFMQKRTPNWTGK